MIFFDVFFLIDRELLYLVCIKLFFTCVCVCPATKFSLSYYNVFDVQSGMESLEACLSDILVSMMMCAWYCVGT